VGDDVADDVGAAARLSINARSNAEASTAFGINIAHGSK
jgi:hypothetical protein